MVHTVKALKNWCFLTVLYKTLECPLDSKKIKSVNPKGNQPWIFTGRTDVEAPILWPPDAKSRLTGKDPDAGKDGGQEKKGTTEDEMVGWHHWLNGHDFEQTLGDGEGQGSQVCCSPWGRKIRDDLGEWTTWFVKDLLNEAIIQRPLVLYGSDKRMIDNHYICVTHISKRKKKSHKIKANCLYLKQMKVLFYGMISVQFNTWFMIHNHCVLDLRWSFSEIVYYWLPFIFLRRCLQERMKTDTWRFNWCFI